MRTSVRSLAAVVASLALASPAVAQYTAYGLTTAPGGAQQLVRFDTGMPTAVTTLGFTGVTLTGIDFRPATGQLWGYDGGALYTLDLTTGAARRAFTLTSTTTGNTAFDFNPTVDRIRAVSPGGTNLRLNPNDGSTTVDGAYVYAPGDPNFGQTPSFTAAAYTNNDNDPTTGTTLYTVDRNFGTLVRVDAPNGGNVSTIGSLGLGTGVQVLGFDIVTVGTSNFAFLSTFGMGSPVSQLFRVNLATGATTFAGNIGAANGVTGLAIAPTQVVPEPGTWALLATGLAGLGVVARRRRA